MAADYVDHATCAAHRRETLKDAEKYTDRCFGRSVDEDARMWDAIDKLRITVEDATKWLSRAVIAMLLTVIGELSIALILIRGG